MSKIDFWTLFTGIITIASFLLAMWDRFPRLKKYLLPLGYILLGFTFGRISFISNEVVVDIIKDSQAASSLIIISSLLFFSLYCFHVLIKRGSEMMAYAIIVILLSIIAPSLLTSFSKANEKISPKDYLALSVIYEKNSDYDDALKYLNKYLEAVSDAQLKEQIKSKVLQLKQKQLDEFK